MATVDQPYEVLQRPQCHFTTEVKVDAAKDQAASPLFKLSAELRANIWDIVVGMGDIHICETPCERNGKWMRVEKYRYQYHSPHAPEGSERLEIQQISKLTSHVCLRDGHWSRQYALSHVPAKIPDEYFDERGLIPRTGPFCEQAVSPYCFAHVRCSSGVRHATNLGKPWLPLLQTCRRVYAEVWHLPFVKNTFEFASPQSRVRKDFATRLLFPHQRSAIRSVHVHDLTELSAFTELLECFPGIKRLRVSFRPGDCIQGADDDWRAFRKQHSLENVEIIVGYDYDRSDNRAMNREKASASEHLLTGPVEN